MSGSAPSVIDPERRSALSGAKLRSLVNATWGANPGANPGAGAGAGSGGRRITGRFPGGATLVDPVAATTWVLVDSGAARSLGGVLAWASSAPAERPTAGGLHLIIGDRSAAAVVARQAALFDEPPTVWVSDDLAVHPAVPAPPHCPRPAPEGVESLVDVLTTQGVDVRIEHGSVVGEWLGLEIARIVVDPERGPRLDVGVGRHDREAFTLVHGELPAPEAISRVLTSVRAARSARREHTPISRLGRQRWLRSMLLVDPSAVGATQLRPVEPTVEIRSVNDSVAATAVGVDQHGTPIVVACSVGIDPDAVPAAADARLAYSPDARLVIAVPERDRHRVTESLASSLRSPAEVVSVAVPWSALDLP